MSLNDLTLEDPALWIALITMVGAVTLVAAVAKNVVSRLRSRSQELREQDELLSRRCDELSHRLDQWTTRDRIDHLSDLVRAGVRGGRLEPEVGRQLEAYLRELRSPEA